MVCGGVVEEASGGNSCVHVTVGVVLGEREVVDGMVVLWGLRARWAVGRVESVSLL